MPEWQAQEATLFKRLLQQCAVTMRCTWLLPNSTSFSRCTLYSQVMNSVGTQGWPSCCLPGAHLFLLRAPDFSLLYSTALWRITSHQLTSRAAGNLMPVATHCNKAAQAGAMWTPSYHHLPAQDVASLQPPWDGYGSLVDTEVLCTVETAVDRASVCTASVHNAYNVHCTSRNMGGCIEKKGDY